MNLETRMFLNQVVLKMIKTRGDNREQGMKNKQNAIYIHIQYIYETVK